jgi:hypothetical protein
MRIRIVVCAVILAAAAGLQAAVIDVTLAPYSANGGDAVDDTTAIQNALNAVPAAGGEVYVPAGTYYISAPLQIKSRTTLRGDGYRASELQLTNGGYDDLLENADFTNGNEGIIIEDLQLDGNKAGQSSYYEGMCIDLRKATDFTVQRVYVHDCVRDGIHVMDNSRRGKIVDNIVRHNGKDAGDDPNYGGNGIGIPSGIEILISRNIITENLLSGIDMEKSSPLYHDDSVQRITIADNQIISNAEIGISSEGESDGYPNLDVTITGNEIAGNLEGIRVQETRGFIIANNGIRNTLQHGIQIVGLESIDGTITGNHIYNPGASVAASFDGIFIDSTQQRITMTGNNIQGVGSGGVQFMRRAINAPSATNLTIVANTGRGGSDPTQINAPSLTNLVSTNKTN